MQPEGISPQLGTRVSLVHTSLRDWLLGPSSGVYHCDARHGHALLAALHLRTLQNYPVRQWLSQGVRQRAENEAMPVGAFRGMGLPGAPLMPRIVEEPRGACPEENEARQRKAEASEIVYLVLDTAFHLDKCGYGSVADRAFLLQSCVGELVFTRGSRGRTAIHRAAQKGRKYAGALSLLLQVWPEGGELPVEKHWWDQNDPIATGSTPKAGYSPEDAPKAWRKGSSHPDLASLDMEPAPGSSLAHSTMKGTSEPVGTVTPVPDINNMAAVFQTTAPAVVPPSATPQPPP